MLGGLFQHISAEIQGIILTAKQLWPTEKERNVPQALPICSVLLSSWIWAQIHFSTHLEKEFYGDPQVSQVLGEPSPLRLIFPQTHLNAKGCEYDV